MKLSMNYNKLYFVNIISIVLVLKDGVLQHQFSLTTPITNRYKCIQDTLFPMPLLFCMYAFK